MSAGRAIAVAAALVALAQAAPVRGEVPVDTELVLAVDMSQSMDRGEHRLQREGYIAALSHPDVLRAIQSGMYGRVALTYVEWGGPGGQAVVVPWTLVEDAASAERVARALAAAPVRTIHGTSISGALTFAAGLFDGNGFEGFRRVIDVSGDGPNSSGAPVVPARDRALAADVIINGLPIMLRAPSFTPWSIPDLDLYYTDCVIGGPGSFVIPVEDPGQFVVAIRQKLVLDIARAPPRVLPAAETAREPRIDCLIGEKLRRQWYGP